MKQKRICLTIEELRKLVDDETFNRVINYVKNRRVGRPKIDVDPKHIKQLLTRYHGNKRAVARTIGISPTTLYKLLKKYGIK